MCQILKLKKWGNKIHYEIHPRKNTSRKFNTAGEVSQIIYKTYIEIGLDLIAHTITKQQFNNEWKHRQEQNNNNSQKNERIPNTQLTSMFWCECVAND